MAKNLSTSVDRNDVDRPGKFKNIWRCTKRGFVGCLWSLILVPVLLSIFLYIVVLADYLLRGNPIFVSTDFLLYVPGFVSIFLVMALFISWASIPLLVVSPVVGMVGGVLGGGAGSFASNKKAIDIGATIGGVVLSGLYLIYLLFYFKTLFLNLG